ncbi:LGFP repeat-containing protein [Streptomyces sp. NPDC093149]|uniref:LGFP repeat-containing protein n=1 Tax=Streptomyces sp. NPDC093149 TaxID=3366031 RepID=UPI003813BAB4
MVVALASLVALIVQASPATADDVCGKQVGGAILVKYTELNRETGPLGCPTSIELDNPDGVGKRQEFAGGTIYWSAASNAHPVWGTIGGKWGQSGWESGFLGYPLSDELTNPDNVGKRQQFQGGTVYWHPTLSNGAHAVRESIGGLWGELNWEAGAFGYPTSDERWDSELRQTYQTFSGKPGAKIWYTTNSAPDVEGCPERAYCAGYRADTSANWVSKVGVVLNQETGVLTISAFPTETGYDDADTNYDELWRQIWDTVPYPSSRLTADQGSSVYEQMACHARYAYKIFGHYLGGVSWDFESDRPNISWDEAMNPLAVAIHGCNWN